jgi:choline-sulfatase
MTTNRRSFMAGLATAAASLATLSFAESGKQSPNVLILMSDQHKRSCMGAYGDSVAKTPNLDSLAASATRFTDAYCTNPVCTPSRASIMTGLYSHNNEAQNNSTPYSPEHKTMAHHFSAAGYMTGLIGKMHWVDAQTHGFDYHIDFNEWFQYLGPKMQIFVDELGPGNHSGAGIPEIEDLWKEEGDPWKGHVHIDDRKGSVSLGRVSQLEEKDHFDNFVARESIRFLRRFGKSGKPFFLISSFLKPHDPFMPAKRFADMFKAEDMKLPPSWGKVDTSKRPAEVRKSIAYNGPTPELSDSEKAKEHIALYYASLAQMDDCLGQVVREVESLGLEQDTIICYFSDHGEMLGDLGLWEKFEFYEGSCGVPLLLHVPGRSAGVCKTPVSLVSMSATLTDLAGVKQVRPNDGKSFARSVENPSAAQDYGPVFAEYGLGSRQPKAMVRRGEWKLSYWLNDIPELYNLHSDPQELQNLAFDPAHKAKLDELEKVLFDWHKPS